MDRRNRVLAQMVDFGVIDATTGEAAMAQSLGVTKSSSPSRTRYPAFVDLVRRQLRRDYHDDVLRNDGLRIFTTLDPTVQTKAESSAFFANQ